jgi:hypothetical protein
MGNIGGRTSVEIEAPIAEVWKLVEDVLLAPQWQNGVLSMVALEKDAEGRPTLVEVENDVKVRSVKAKVRFLYAGPEKLSWTQEKGDLKSVVGAWTLEDLGGERTRATYSLDVDPGRVLGMLIRGPVEGFIRSALINARPGELKKLVEEQ